MTRGMMMGRINVAPVIPTTGAAATAGQYLAGMTVNPFLFMMFDSPTFKEHTLDWIFAPKSRQESKDLDVIIKEIKMRSLPQADLGIMLNYPDIAIIKLNPDNHLFKFRPCAVLSVSVNYTAAGTPSFFDTGSPSVVSLQIRLREIEIWTKNNFDGPATDGDKTKNVREYLKTLA
jgi:hypothetical protein